VCVDFRYQRLGIGSLLVEWGLANAKTKGLPAQTEAGPIGLRMYLKLGFESIGTWKVPTKNGEDEFMEFPVLKLTKTEEL
jgi:predicted N-acetyltransferase YhbS